MHMLTTTIHFLNDRRALFFYFLILLLSIQKLRAQDEFELLYGMEEGYSLTAQNQLVSQWTSHANSVSKNKNCINQIEGEFNRALSQNATGLSIGLPYQAQVNYSACKMERFFIDTLTKEIPTPHLIKYHISGCFDPNKSLSPKGEPYLPLNEVPLLVTYISNEDNKSGYMAFDHYGFSGPESSEEKAIAELFYEMNGLKLLCEEKGYNIYQIKNATKHPTNISVEQRLKDRGVDLNSCYAGRNNAGLFEGRYSTMVEKYYDLEIRYILIGSPNGKNTILVRFTNKNKEFMAQARISKGISTSSTNQKNTLYELPPNTTMTLKLNNIVELEYNFTMPPGVKDKTLIEMAKEYIRKQVTVDENKKLKVKSMAAIGIRG